MIEIFTDGGCRNKHGKWGWLATFRERKLCTGVGTVNQTTHMAMELYAVIDALKTFDVCDIDITIYSDSAYVVNCMNDRWYDEWKRNGWMTKSGNEVKNIVYWEELLSLNLKHVKFRHVRAHRTDKSKFTIFNNFVDNLASMRKKS